MCGGFLEKSLVILYQFQGWNHQTNHLLNLLHLLARLHRLPPPPIPPPMVTK